MPSNKRSYTLAVITVLVFCSLLAFTGRLPFLQPAHAAGFVVTNVNDSGPGSLRQAMIDANSNPGPDTITFSIGSGLQTIAPLNALPTISDTVVIDGTTQPGFGGSPLIQLDGTNAGQTIGLFITAGSSTVRGLLIHSFAGQAIVLAGGGDNLIAGNAITNNVNGNAACCGAAGNGVVVESANNTIGGSTGADQISTFNVSGHVVDDSANSLGGVTINLSGAVTTQVTTDGSGNYSFANLPAGGNYTATPISSSYSFGPASQTFNNLDQNRIANFVGTQTVVGIAGSVTDSSNVPINNVSVSLTMNGAPAGTTATNVLGNYTFGNLTAGANYVVTPTGSFTPSSQTLNNLTTNAIAHFKAAPSIPSQCNTLNFAKTDFATDTGALGAFAAVAADFNGDGNTDLAVTNITAGTVSLLLGIGNGSFGAATNIVLGQGAYSLAAGDFNNDGKPDLATVNNAANNFSVLLGTGTGSFAAPTNFSGVTSARSVVTRDFNNDGKLDLAIANFGSHNVSIVLGDGAGGFSAPTSFATGTNATSVTAADFNNDGLLDLAVANFGPDNLSVLLGNGAGGFAAATNFAVGVDPFFVRTGDFNSDGKVDLAVANVNSNDVSILLGTGTGSFGAATSFPAGTAPTSVVIGDFNGDGKSDLAASNNTSPGTVSIRMGTGAGSFGSVNSFATGLGSRPLAIGDFNADGKLDLAVPNQSSNNVSVLLNTSTTCNTQSALAISGQITIANNNPLAAVTVTLSGPITRVVSTDSNGNYSFPNLVPGGDYAVTVQSNYFVFLPSRQDFFNLSSSQTANFITAPVAVPAPVPPPSDNFTSPTRDANKWTIGVQTESPVAFDPQVTTTQVNGQLVIAPVSQAVGLHFGGYASANSFDLRNGKVSVEVVKAASGGADTIFAIGSDSDNFCRFMVHTVGTPTTLAPTAKGREGRDGPLDATTAQLIFQISIGGQITALSISYDPVQHRFLRFRHEPATNSIAFETSPNDSEYTVQHRVTLQRSVSALTAELSAGTTNPATPGTTVFDNFGLVTSTFQFSAGNYAVGESDGRVLVTVTRTGSTAAAASVDFATADGTALQRTRYINAAGTLNFATGELSKNFEVLVADNSLSEGDQTVNLLLMNPSGSGLNSPARALLNIHDNDSSAATGNPLDDPRFFVTQNYFDFLSRFPDQGGSDFWIGQIAGPPACLPGNASCMRDRRITVSNAFFFELEFQQTGAYVFRLYRTAFGNNQPFPNPDGNPQFPGQNLKLPGYSVFASDRAQVVGGASLSQSQLDLANAFVLRPEFLARYPATLDGPAFVDALLATIMNDLGVNLSSLRTALIDLFNQPTQGGRGAVLYRLADDNQQSNPINNRPLIDAEYVRSFVATQYFGYLRRDADIGGFLFWLGQVNSAPLRDLSKQRAMVCSFITSGEYQQRFSSIVTHTNQECQ